MKRFSAFSLVEVVIAIGLLATGVGGILGLMAASSKMIGDASDRHGAERALVNGAAELERLGFAIARTRLTDDGVATSETNQYFESRDGTRSGWGSELSTTDRFYSVSFYRLAGVSPAGADSTGQGLAVLIRAEWPANGTEKSSIQSSHVILR